eukprot:1488724-Pleurochrysis_carterae.AAC.2
MRCARASSQARACGCVTSHRHAAARMRACAHACVRSSACAWMHVSGRALDASACARMVEGVRARAWACVRGEHACVRVCECSCVRVRASACVDACVCAPLSSTDCACARTRAQARTHTRTGARAHACTARDASAPLWTRQASSRRRWASSCPARYGRLTDSALRLAAYFCHHQQLMPYTRRQSYAETGSYNVVCLQATAESTGF